MVIGNTGRIRALYADADELHSEIANGRVLTAELYAHRNQKLIFLHLFTELFHKDIFPCFSVRAEMMLLRIYLLISMGTLCYERNSHPTYQFLQYAISDVWQLVSQI